MSTVSQTPQVRTVRTSNSSYLSLFIAAALMITLVVILNVVAGSRATKLINYRAYMLHRQGEWVSVPIPVDSAEAYLIHRQGEWASVAVPAVDLTAYHLSERTLVDPNAGPAIYQQSERTLVDSQAGLAIYQQSERTSIPVCFNKYQRSEWFGE